MLPETAVLPCDTTDCVHSVHCSPSHYAVQYLSDPDFELQFFVSSLQMAPLLLGFVSYKVAILTLYVNVLDVE